MLQTTALEDSGYVVEDTGHRQVQGVSMGLADCWRRYQHREVLLAAVLLQNAVVRRIPTPKQAKIEMQVHAVHTHARTPLTNIFQVNLGQLSGLSH